MKKRTAKIILYSTAILTLFITAKGTRGITSKASTESLLWSDEFNGTSLDTSVWNYAIGNGGWGNNELQYYTDSTNNVSVSDGTLKITAKKESKNGSNYTSGRITTQGLKTFRYGKIEARIKLPTGQGIWPAFWMLGSNETWPACGEIDIMEHVNNESTAYGTIHWDCNGHAEYGGKLSNLDFTQYHTYTIDWTKDYIRWYIDGVQFHEANIADNINSTEEFHQNFYLLLNVAVGGNWPGSPDSSTTFPATMYVDYIRVYQNEDTIIEDSSDSNTSTEGILVSNGSSATTYITNTQWADIHYTINNGTQQNVRMTQTDTNSSYTINNLSSNDTVEYWFTICDSNGVARDTSKKTYTHPS